jgi:hypothetical protein
VVAGPGITVQNATGGALVSAVVRSVTAGNGINVSETTTGNLVVSSTTGGAGIGFDQSWLTFTITPTSTAQRRINTTYTNTTGKPIQVAVSGRQTDDGRTRFLINGVEAYRDGGAGGAPQNVAFQFIVPPDNTYRYEVLTGSVTLVTWAELR